MEKFARWSGVAHTVIRKHHAVKLGQVHQLLSACFGHPSYASFRQVDLTVFNSGARFVCFDEAAGLDRARGLGLALTEVQWRDVRFALSPSGVSGNTWLTDLRGMEGAARVTFDGAGHPRIQEIKRSIGTGDGHWARASRCLSEPDTLPDTLLFEVLGDVQGFSEHASLSVPVASQVQFRRIGRRMYATGELLSIDQCGEPTEYEPDFEAEIYGMSED